MQKKGIFQRATFAKNRKKKKKATDAFLEPSRCLLLHVLVDKR